MLHLEDDASMMW